MQEPEVGVAKIEELRRAKRRWKLTAICTLAALAAVLSVDVVKTRILMNQIRLERDRALQAESQADVQREEFLGSLLRLAQDATRYAKEKNAADSSPKK